MANRNSPQTEAIMPLLADTPIFSYPVPRGGFTGCYDGRANFGHLIPDFSSQKLNISITVYECYTGIRLLRLIYYFV